MKLNFYMAKATSDKINKVCEISAERFLKADLSFYHHIHFKNTPQCAIERTFDKKFNPKKVLDFLNENFEEIAIKIENYNPKTKGYTEKIKLYQDKENKILIKSNIFSSDSCDSYLSISCHRIEDKNKIEDILEQVDKLYNESLLGKKQEIHIISNSDSYCYLNPIVTDHVNVNVKLNYGVEFEEKHNLIINKLKTKKSGGLYILRGCPGSGKSSYIKYLTGLIERKFVYIPCSMIETITYPSFATMLNSEKGCVLVIEDAEKSIISRENGESNQALVSSILNLSDGILSSAYECSIILSFNTSVDKIDQALLRKGRLMVDHEFKELKKEDAQTLISHLNKEYKAEGPMTLSEIYNLEDKSFGDAIDSAKRKIGFLQ